MLQARATRMATGRHASRRVLCAVGVLAGVLVAGAAGDRDAPFVVETNPFVIGQAADWLDRTHVVWHEPLGRDEGGDGEVQIYRSTLDGREQAA